MDKNTKRLTECVFDSATVVYGGGSHALRYQEWFDQKFHNSRMVWHECCQIAEFYEANYPEDEDYLTTIEDLTRAWFKRSCNQELTERDTEVLKMTTLPKVNWDETFKKLRELADKADALASELQETQEYQPGIFGPNTPVSWQEHGLAKDIVSGLTNVMRECAEFGERAADMADEEEAV